VAGRRIAGRQGQAAFALALAVAVGLAGGGGALGATRRAGPPAATGTISTVAGRIGGPASATRVSMEGPDGASPCGPSFGHGRPYIGDTSVVREVNPQTDQLTTPAATGSLGPLGDDGAATAAYLDACGTAVDDAGNLMTGDAATGRIRVVAASTGTFYTIAGNGLQGFSSTGEQATVLTFPQPAGVATDSAGNLIITGGNRVLVVAASSGTFYARAMKAAHLYSVAGNGYGDGDGDGDIGDGGPGTKAKVYDPQGVVVDGDGNLLIADRFNNRIRVLAASTGTFYGQAMTTGYIYTVAGHGTFGIHGNGVPATATQLGQPTGVAVDSAGNLVIALEANNKIRVVADSTGTFYGQAMTAGDIYTIAGDRTPGFSGDQGKAVRAELDNPYDVAVDGAGNILIADTGNQRIRVVAASTGSFYGQQMTAGDIYTIAGDGQPGFAGDGSPATAAELSGPTGLALDSAGNILIADTGNQRIRVVAASTGSFYGQQMTAGDIYTIAGPATPANLNDPGDVVVGGTGNILIADTGNDRIREVQELPAGP
jgi:sugar lactone lactonase YvrE